MFGFMDMMDNYESRKVGNNKLPNDGFVSTARVTDSSKPYETAVKHKDYNDGQIIIVEMYDTIEEAKIGHKKWKTIMLNTNLPNQLMDVSTAKVALIANKAGRNTIFKKKN